MKFQEFKDKMEQVAKEAQLETHFMETHHEHLVEFFITFKKGYSIEKDMSLEDWEAQAGDFSKDVKKGFEYAMIALLEKQGCTKLNEWYNHIDG